MKDKDLERASRILVKELFRIGRGEHVLVTVDGRGDEVVARALGRAAADIGAKVAVVSHTPIPPEGLGPDEYLPDPVKAAIKNCDVLLDLGKTPLFHSSAHYEALRSGRTRSMSTSFTEGSLIRSVGGVDFPSLRPFLKRVAEMTQGGGRIRFTSPSGTDVSFEMGGCQVHCYRGECGKEDVENPDSPGLHALPGYITWEPRLESANGVIACDHMQSEGSKAHYGVLKTAIKLTIRAGRVEEIDGSKEAEELKRWLRTLDDENMYYLAHAFYGFNPTSQLGGMEMETCTVWGQTGWGIGDPFTRGAKLHIDVGCFDSSVWIDEAQIMDNGKICDDNLTLYSKKLGK